MHELGENDKELLIRINEVLHYLWDPIGVSDVAEARDEYDSYALQVFSLLKRKAPAKEISNYLTKISVDDMGLKEHKSRDDNIAKILINWMEYFEENHKA